jgi:uncharacterized protein
VTTKSSGAGSPRVLVRGQARGPAVVLEEPLSFWGGVDVDTGRVIDPRHPQAGAELAGKVLVMSSGRGSSSSSSVLAEAARRGTAPAAILLFEPDPILVLGAVVARELYGTTVPVAVIGEGAVQTGQTVEIDGDRVQVLG